MSGFVQEQVPARGRTRSRAFHEDQQQEEPTFDLSAGPSRTYENSEDDDLDEPPVITGRQRTSSFHEDDSEDTSKKKKSKGEKKVKFRVHRCEF